MRNLIGYMKAKGSRKHGTLNAIQMTIDKIDAMQDYEGKHGLVKIGDGADGGKTQLQARERGAEPA